jgi:hypothetical protein
LSYTVNAHGLCWSGKPGQPHAAPDSAQIDLCRSFLSGCDSTKTGRYGSYALKHVIERAVGRYISNGACIQAAVELDLPVGPAFRGYSIIWGKFEKAHPVNAWIGVRKRSVRRVASCGWDDPQIGGAIAAEFGLIHRMEKPECR